jgi:hypothetical protein
MALLDTFLCIHHRDVGYLLETVLRAWEVNFRPRNRLFMITNDPAHLKAFLDRTGVAQDAIVSADSDWLSQKEMALPGWYRQQLIKLRSYQFCETENFCNLGADTLLLQPIEYSDLVDGDFPVLYYTKHRLPDLHVRYERQRVQHIARMLQVEPVRAMKYVDFINDLFCFNRDALIGLNGYLEKRYGGEPYVHLLQGLDDKTRNRFGEWTLYSVYLLDVLKRDVTLRNTRPGFLYQAHSPLSLYFYRFNTKVVHFVSKNFDVDHIRRQIAQYQPELDHQLLTAQITTRL